MVIGLTGGIGCGKSTAGRMFEAAGFSRSDSDLIVRQLLDEEPEVRSALREHFGPGVFLADEQLDRAAIARVVFADEAELAWLEGLLHPRVSAVWQGRIRAQPEKNWCVEIPLLFEKNLEKHVHFTVTVSSTLRVQLERLATKGFSAEQAKARMMRQLPLDEKVARADFLILNDGDHAFLQSQITYLIDHLNHLTV